MATELTYQSTTGLSNRYRAHPTSIAGRAQVTENRGGSLLSNPRSEGQWEEEKRKGWREIEYHEPNQVQKGVVVSFMM